MRRLMVMASVALMLLALAPTVAAASPRESFDSVGFQAFSTTCGPATCTDTFVFAESFVTSSGESGVYACADQFTYNLRTGRGTGQGGCADDVDLTVASDLSSASLGPTSIEICARTCETIIVAADLQASSGAFTFKDRHTESDGTCTFTYSSTGTHASATGSIEWDGDSLAAEGTIFDQSSAFSSRCRR